MSAVNGIFERDGSVFPVAAFSVSLEALADYGHTKTGHWLSPSVGLGHQSSSILPEDADEEFPVYDASARLVVTADARIDNRAELFETLGIALNERQNLSDSRLILRAWQKWKRDCPRYLIGDYAFAVWDEREQVLFCARDHIGAKPFYYSSSPQRFIFASDLKGILAIPDFPDRLDEDFVIASLADKRFYLKDRTYFADIKRLAPGFALTVTKETEKLEQYWFPESFKNIRLAKDEDYAENAREIYTRAVADRLRTTEKVGVHLSGGLDSASVTVLTARHRKKQNLLAPEVFSWQPFPDEAAETAREYSNIRVICRQEDLIPQFCPVNAEDILAILKKDPTREPVHITLHVENTIQKEAAKRGVRLILSGWGGDEVLSFDGRGFYAELLLRGRLWKLFREGRKHGAGLNFIVRESLLLLFSDRNEGIKKLAARSLKAEKISTSLIRPELRNRINLHKMPCRQSSVRETLFWLWTRGMLAERMESWAAHAAPLKIEYAYPMTDRRLMEFVAGLPREQFVGGKYNRRIMRNAMNGVLPPEVCYQPDKGEPIRVEKGLSEVYRAIDLARDEILSSHKTFTRAGYFDLERLMKSLSPETSAQETKQADIIRALQFLDF